MKLYYKPGACSLAPHIALFETGTAFQCIKVDTNTKTTEDGKDYLSVTNKGYVPALELEGGDILTEAPAILQYIADQFPAAELAAENATIDRAKTQSYLNFVSSELHKAYGPFFASKPMSDGARPAALAAIEKRLDILETDFADGRIFLVGSKFSIADCYLWVVLNWSQFIGLELGQWPKIKNYWSRVSQIPSVQKALAAEGLA